MSLSDVFFLNVRLRVNSGTLGLLFGFIGGMHAIVVQSNCLVGYVSALA